MCGICGFVDIRGTRQGIEDSILKMNDLLRHRGPDDQGILVWGRVALGHRRLAIIDLESGHQPMSSEDAKVSIVFNGEIYNFLELRKELEQKAYKFRTRSDTEVLLAAYQEWGESCLTKLNGMFAFAIWDAQKERLFAARDRVGKKPFFYYLDNNYFLFASEIKSILAHPKVKCDIDPLALDEYLTYSYIPAPRTIYRQIRKLPAGHYLIFENNHIFIQRYWRLSFAVTHNRKSEEDLAEELEVRFKEAVRLRLISDVPIGAFLSGGLDSSGVVAMMARLSDFPVKTFTIGFEEEGFSEVEDARKIARHFGTDHEEFIVRPSTVDILPDLVWALDEPFGDSSVLPTYYVAKMASQKVKVVLSGDGGDEIFGGYTRYLEALQGLRWNKIPHGIRKWIILPLALHMAMGALGRNFLYSIGKFDSIAPGYHLGIYPFIKDDLYNQEFKEALHGHNPFWIMDDDILHTSHLDLVSRLQFLDINNYLPNDILTKVDRMSMANSLEVRSPLLDYRLMEFMAGIPTHLKISNGTTKIIFRKVLKAYLPDDSFHKPKQGFGIPKGAWFRRDLNRFAKEILLDPGSFWRDYFRHQVVRRILDEHEKGIRDYSVWIWCLLILELWYKRFNWVIR